MKGQLRTPEDVKVFALAGKAYLTLVSEETGTRFTYRIKKKDKEDPGSPSFVGVLTGPENTSCYSYLGTIFSNGEYRQTAKSKVDPSAPSAKAFDWFFGHVIQNGEMPSHLKIMHEGKCGRCGRLLTVPESVERGIGPECCKFVCTPAQRSFL